MPGKKGNKNGTVLKDEQIRQIAFKEYCDHIASGRSKLTWRFRNPAYQDFHCCWRTMERYIKENPLEFQAIHRERAEVDSYYHWESVVAASATGENEKANTASLQMIMRNRFSWDKKEEAAAEEIKEKLDNFCKSWERARKDQSDS